jgi:hypothetical protein
MRIIKSVPMCVRAVVERKHREYVSGFGDNAVFRDVSRGWFIEIIDYPTVIEAGEQKPNCREGDQIWIEIHKVIAGEQS